MYFDSRYDKITKVMNICKQELHSFLDKTYCFVVNDLDIDLKESFFKAIDNNENNYQTFIKELKNVKDVLEIDLKFFMDSDPAATSLEEIQLAYPGFRAIAIYRISHIIYNLGYKVAARILSEIAHSDTGIDIHPAAKIGYPFFIDHGTGIVIGETSSIGKSVKMYQGVTLGALSLKHAEKLRGVKRHPQVGDNVTLYAGASLLGDITIGNNVTIGSNVFLTENVPSDTRVLIGKPELIIEKK